MKKPFHRIGALILTLALLVGFIPAIPSAFADEPSSEETYTLTMTDISGDFEYHNYPGLYVGRSAIYRIRLFRDSDGAEIPTDTAGVISRADLKSGVVFTNSNTKGGYYHLILAGIKEDSVDYKITADVDRDGVADAELVRTLNVTHQPLTEHSLHYDFLKMCEFYNPGRSSSGYISTGYKTEEITSLDMTTAGHTNEIYPNSYIKTHPWCFVSANLDTPQTSSPYFKYASQNGFGKHNRDMYIRFKVYVPRAGTYTPVTKHSANKYSPKVDIYLAPVQAADPEAAEYHLGTVDTGHPVGVGDPETDAQDNFNYGNYGSSDYVLEPVTLTEPGEYYLTYRWNGRGISGQHSGRFRTAGFILKAHTLSFSDDDVSVYIQFDRDVIQIGDTATASVSGISDSGEIGVIENLENATVQYTSNNPEIATVEKETGVITAIAEGEAEIAVSVTLDGVTKTATRKISCTLLPPPSELKTVSLTFSDTDLTVGETAEAYVTGIMTNGEMADLSDADIVFSSSNTQVAEIDQSGVITAKMIGETNIKAAVTLNGVTREAQAQLAVLPRADETYTLTMTDISGDFEYHNYPGLYVGRSAIYRIRLFRDSDGAEIPTDTAGVISRTQSKSDVVFTNSNTKGGYYHLILAGIKEDSVDYKITADVDRDGVADAELVRTLNVTHQPLTEHSLHYDFLKMCEFYNPGKSSSTYTSTGYKTEQITSLDMTTAGHTNEIYPDSYIKTHPWCFVSANLDTPSTSSPYFKYASQNGFGKHNRDMYIRFKVYVPRAGTYTPVTKHTANIYSPKVDIYLAPVHAADPAAAEYHLGTVDTGHPEGVGDPETNAPDNFNYGNHASSDYVLEPVTLTEPGEYYLTYRWNGRGISGKHSGRFRTAGFILKAHTLSFSDDDVSVYIQFDRDGIQIGDTATASVSGISDSGEIGVIEDLENATVQYTSNNPEIATVEKETGVITAIAEGEAEIAVSVTLDGVTKTATRKIICSLLPPSRLLKAVYLTLSNANLNVGRLAEAYVTGIMANREMADLSDADIVFSSSNTQVAEIDQSGVITAKMTGETNIKAAVTLNGVTREAQAALSILAGKTEPTLFTYEKRETAKENIEKYDWAENICKGAIMKADRYVGKEELLWNLVVPEGLPRYYQVREKNDPKNLHCPYCETDLERRYGRYPFLTNALTHPWKIQCPHCKRRFPSNDFGSYYKSGLDEHGIFQPDLADRSLLTNDLYPEMDTKLGVTGWGVDDGFGYFPGNVYENGVVERHNPIAYYLHEGLWHGGAISDALTNLTKAYVFTGEAKYGRPGAILLDRIADFYPDYDWYQWRSFRASDDRYHGKILDRTWETNMAQCFAEAYDAFFPVYEDPQVIRFLSEKANQYKMDNPKNSALLIRRNAEDGILREIYKACLEGNIVGNFGMKHRTLATAAIVLDSMPETKEWLEWLMRPGEPIPTQAPATGGNIIPQLINVVDRDGAGNESAPNYNNIWLSALLDTAELIHDYGKYPEIDLYKNPKFIKMFSAQVPIILASYYTVQIGDSGATASNDILLNMSTVLTGFKRTGNPNLAQIAYLLNGNSVEGLHEYLYQKNPEDIQKEILDVIENYGEFNLGSLMMTGYGFAVLRDGVKLTSESADRGINTLRDFWIYFGGAESHRHLDSLNLGIDAYGLNMAPDLGYPEQTARDPNRLQWVQSTLSHNTVMVDEKSQEPIFITESPLHFDDSGKVKIMEIDSPNVYPQTQIYRRTLVMVEANDDVSYGVDFFRVCGGDDHIYSFHSQSEEVDVEDLTLTAQNGGTYAGKDVPLGPDPYTNHGDSWFPDYLMYPPGATWLDTVRRDENPPKSFSVDFKVKDFRRVLHDSRDLHLRMTMLNDFNLDEVAIAQGYPPNVVDNMKYMNHLEYVLARRTGNNLDSLFTTVFEPYKGERYIESMEDVPVVVTDGNPGELDVAKAVKVVHKNGRRDYIVYATNNTVKYKIDDLFEFRGSVGVYTVKDNGEELEPIYWYINDGDTIAENTDIIPAYTGTIKDFTREFSLENKIIADFDSQINPEILAGKYIYIDNSTSSSPENGAYRILGAKHVSENTYELDIGDVTVIYSLYDGTDINGGYVYNIKPGQNFRIPLPAASDATPVFKETGDKTVDVGSEIRFTVEAESPIGKPIKYKAKNPPRGSVFDPESRTFIWRPEKNQVGEHVVAIEASDGALSRTQYIKVKVLPSTMVPKPKDPGGTNGSGVGGGSGTLGDASGNGGGSSGSGPDGDGSPGGIVIPPVTPDIGERFTDLAGFDWARDAINDLAGKGVITGRGEKFAPGENITRADFVLLLSRALGFSGDGEGFADVPEGAYYGDALKAAKANGIITGIGNNKFNPTGEITREDMMVIVARALEKMGIALEDAPEDVLNEFGDSGDISDYAKSAVALLVKNGLIKGADGRINPKGRATRAEIAVLIHRILTEFAE